MRVLSFVILPLASLAMELRTWRLVYTRGWRKILPIFSYYIAFYSITTTLLLGLSYCSLYPGRMQQTICLIDSYSSYSAQIVSIIFLMVVLYELLAHTSRDHSEVKNVITIIGVITLAIASALAGVSAAMQGAPTYCLLLAQFTGVFARTTAFIITILLALMLVFKRVFTLRWGTGISLILLGLAQLFTVEIALNVAAYNGSLASVSAIIAQISGFVW